MNNEGTNETNYQLLTHIRAERYQWAKSAKSLENFINEFERKMCHDDTKEQYKILEREYSYRLEQIGRFKNLIDAEKDAYFRYVICPQHYEKIALLIFLYHCNDFDSETKLANHLLKKFSSFSKQKLTHQAFPEDKWKKMLFILQILCYIDRHRFKIVDTQRIEEGQSGHEKKFQEQLQRLISDYQIEPCEPEYSECYGITVSGSSGFPMLLILQKLGKLDKSTTNRKLQEVWFYDLTLRENYEKVIADVENQIQEDSYYYRLIILPANSKEIPDCYTIDRGSLGLSIAILTWTLHKGYWSRLPYIATGTWNLDTKEFGHVDGDKEKTEVVQSFSQYFRFFYPKKQDDDFSILTNREGVDDLKALFHFLKADPLEDLDILLADYVKCRDEKRGKIKEEIRKDLQHFQRGEKFQKGEEIIKQIQQIYIEEASKNAPDSEDLKNIAREELELYQEAVINDNIKLVGIPYEYESDSLLLIVQRYLAFLSLWHRRREAYLVDEKIQAKIKPWPFIINISDTFVNVITRSGLENWLCDEVGRTKPNCKHIFEYALQRDRILFLIPFTKDNWTESGITLIQKQFDEWKKQGREHRILWMVNDLIHYKYLEALYEIDQGSTTN